MTDMPNQLDEGLARTIIGVTGGALAELEENRSPVNIVNEWDAHNNLLTRAAAVGQRGLNTEAQVASFAHSADTEELLLQQADHDRVDAWVSAQTADLLLKEGVEAVREIHDTLQREFPPEDLPSALQ